MLHVWPAILPHPLCASSAADLGHTCSATMNNPKFAPAPIMKSWLRPSVCVKKITSAIYLERMFGKLGRKFVSGYFGYSITVLGL